MNADALSDLVLLLACTASAWLFGAGRPACAAACCCWAWQRLLVCCATAASIGRWGRTVL